MPGRPSHSHHGSIRGFVSTAVVMGTGAGPWLFAFGYKSSGDDFIPVMIVFACLAVPLGIGAALLTRPTPPVERDPEKDRLDELMTDEPDPPGASL